VAKKHIEELLQLCIAAFDSGSAPEECLAAYPEHRAVLEPLLRQAISLRVAYACSPRPEFREQAKRRFMFAAGREVSQALSAQPSSEFVKRAKNRFMFTAGREVAAAFEQDPDKEFVQDARQRLIHAAGSEAQETLRNVPPPRLPFWSNARRRLLETAREQQNGHPVARRAGSGSLALRASLSAAVVVLAVAVAGLAYMVGFQSQPQSANAEYAALERDLQELEQQALSGQPISASAVQQVAERTNKLLDKIDSPGEQKLVEKLPALIERQKEVVLAASTGGPIAPELQQAQLQLTQSANKVEEIRQAVAQTELPTSTAEPAAIATAPPTQEPSPPPAAAATAPPADTPVATASPVATSSPVEEKTVLISPLTDDRTNGQAWKQVQTANISLAIPDAWRLAGVELDSSGRAELEANSLVFTADGIVISVNLNTGNINAVIGDQPQLVLRSGGVGGRLAPVDEAFLQKAGSFAVVLKHVMDTIELSGALTPPPPPTPTPPPSTATPPPVTASPSATVTP
jgi:hypothetical protein